VNFCRRFVVRNVDDVVEDAFKLGCVASHYQVLEQPSTLVLHPRHALSTAITYPPGPRSRLALSYQMGALLGGTMRRALAALTADMQDSPAIGAGTALCTPLSTHHCRERRGRGAASSRGTFRGTFAG
jgi:hypothetical protein